VSPAGRPSATRLALLGRLADLVAARQQDHPVRVAIDGVDAAGKTTLADELAGALAGRGRPVIRASVDGFGRPRAERHRRGELSPTGYWLDAFDYPALRGNLLDPLGPGGSRRHRTASFDVRSDRPRRGPLLVAPPDAVLLLDGVFLLRPELNDAWDLRIFLEVSLGEALRRALARDRALFGSAQAVRARYRRRYLPAQRRYLTTVQPRRIAEVVVDNHDPTAPRLLTSTLAPRADQGRVNPPPRMGSTLSRWPGAGSRACRSR
jgi:uridine kinase